jgi:hypothetical protein
MFNAKKGRTRRNACASVLVMAALWGMVPATAHHTGAMFDRQKPLELSGTVRVFQWTNPHCWIQLLVPGKNGDTVEWSVEMGPPMDLFRNGWKPGTLKAGDKITVVVYPMRDGSTAGLFVSATGSDGKLLGKDQ